MAYGATPSSALIGGYQFAFDITAVCLGAGLVVAQVLLHAAEPVVLDILNVRRQYGGDDLDVEPGDDRPAAA
jgi:hypothetical protein